MNSLTFAGLARDGLGGPLAQHRHVNPCGRIVNWLAALGGIERAGLLRCGNQIANFGQIGLRPAAKDAFAC